METPAHTRELDAVRRRRAELRESFGALERALAAPASARSVIWGEQVLATVVQLRVDFAEHVEVTEGPDGLHQSILSGDLRLANAVAALTAEHLTIATDIAALAAAAEPPVTHEDVSDVRERGTQLLGRLARHRQRGADLVYEAFDTDIGGGD
jgi:hypothetical protein